MCFFFSFFLGCSTKLGLLNKEEVESVRNGEDLDKIAMKMSLALVSLCTNFNCVRNEPTKRAIEYLQCTSNGDYNFNKIVRKRARITYVEEESSDEEGEIVDRIETENVDQNTIEHNIECSVVVAKDFDIDDFVEDVIEGEEGEIFNNFKVGEEEPDMLNELFFNE